MAALETPNLVLRGGNDLVLLAVVGLAAVTVAGVWKTFLKANQPGWAALVPFYNLYIMLEIGDNEWWWLLVLFVPLVNVYAVYRIFAGVSKAFGRGRGFALGLVFLGIIFWPLLGFGEYSYQGSPEDVLDERLDRALDASDEGPF